MSLTAYNERGEAFQTTDPAGMVNRSYADDAGRTVRTIQNFVASTDPACFCPGNEQNVVTEFVHGPGAQLKELIAVNPVTGNQITRYEHGVTLGESDVASNRLLRAEVYPDAADSADRVTFAWNRLQQRKRMRDQNGSVHEYAFDGLGRQAGDSVTTLGAGVDGAVRRIGQTYEVRGLVEKITSFSDAAGTTPVNEVQNVYNSFAQLAEQYQEHDGAVNTGTTPKVQYGYADGGDNTIRPTSLTYPNGRVLDYLYDDESADKLSRIRALRFDGTDVCRYAYLGLNTFVTVQYPEPGIEYNLATGSGANRYAGLDRYGRIVELLWQRTNGSSSSSSSWSSSSGSGPGNALVHLKYGYDRASNRTFREDLVAKSYGKNFDELYEYDGLHRLKKFHRGRLVDDNTAIESPTLQQGWVLDATGNWRNFTQNDQADADQTLDQERLHNRVNEITAIARTVGPQWATPEYDRNGNMTVIPQPKEMTKTFQGTWDAWNRLVKLVDTSTSQTVAEYHYDGQNWRIAKRLYEAGQLATIADLYSRADWQTVEERDTSLNGSSSSSSSISTPARHYVWGLRYIDDLILRDRSVISSLDERIYALQDANWNVVALSDAVGNVVERYFYDPYGTLTIYNADWSDTRTSSLVNNSTLYTGRWLHEESGLYYYRARYYDSTFGRFINRDPIGYGDGHNAYSYVGNDPTNSTDPTGLWKLVRGTIYEAEGCEDSLMSLSWEITSQGGGTPTNDEWVCIWPIPDAALWDGYPWAKEGARADVRNLVATDGAGTTELKLMPVLPRGDHYLRGVMIMLNNDRRGGRVRYWIDGPNAARMIRSTSAQGRTPIRWMAVGAHCGGGAPVGDMLGGRLFQASDLAGVADEKDNSTNSYASASRMIGPPKCWFTRSAQIWGVGCNTNTWASDWAARVMRRGSTANGTTAFVWGTWFAGGGGMPATSTLYFAAALPAAGGPAPPPIGGPGNVAANLGAFFALAGGWMSAPGTQ